MKRILYFLIICCMATSCGVSKKATRASLYPKMYEEKPLTLLVMPPINNSPYPEAKDLLYASITRPLVEAGYYVISPLVAEDVLKAENVYDSEKFFDAPLADFQNLFGADAVVFSVIDSWEKRGFGIATGIRYVIKSAHTNEVLFDRNCDLYLDLSVYSAIGGTLGSVVNLAATAINSATTEHIVAARQSNYFIFSDIPQGKYGPEYMQDQQKGAQEKDIFEIIK